MTESNGVRWPERLAVWRDRANRLSLPVLCSALVLAVMAYIGVYLYWDRGYIWLDETFSLWATEGTRSVWGMQTDLLKIETNPPLHFWLLYGFRRLIDEPRLAGHALNLMIAGLSLVTITGLHWRAMRPRLGAVLGVVYLMSASTMSFMQDIRPGFTAISLCAVAVALSGHVRLNGGAGLKALMFASLLGLLIGISHVYAALFTGALATAVILEAYLIRNRPQLVFGLVLGAACSLSFGMWWLGLMYSTGGHLHAITWLADKQTFNLNLIWSAYLGPIWLSLFIGAGIMLAVLTREGRRAFMIPAICVVLVVSIVLIISLKKPIIFFRYFLILGPAFHLLIALAVCDLFRAYEAAPHDRRKGLAALGSALTLCVPITTGVANAAFLIPHQDSWWSGIDRVRAEAAHCPARLIRVNIFNDPGMAESKTWGFTYLLSSSGLKPEDALAIRDVADIDCRIVAWAEHMPEGDELYVGHPVTDADLLKLMKLTNQKGLPLKTERHRSGFVIYKQTR